MKNLRWIVKTCAGREHYLPYLRKHLPEDTEFCFDDTAKGVVGNSIKALRLAGKNPAVIMEDDILLTRDFEAKARAVIEERPLSLIQFFSMRKADLTEGSRLEPGRSYLMNQCHYMPPGLGRMLADYMEKRIDARPVNRGGSDSLYRDFLADHKIRYWLHVPSLVDHRVGPSAIDPSRGSTNRQSFTFTDPIPDDTMDPKPPKIVGDLSKPHMVEPQAKYLRSVYERADTILEYGSGGSTSVAASMPGKTIYAVENDAGFLKVMMEHLQDAPSQPHFHFVDMGEPGKWGRVTDLKENGSDYATTVWDLPKFTSPDVVLIDGRFRAACFVTTLARISKPATILFDDYVGRPNYHWISELLPVSEKVGRMAVFYASPGNLPGKLWTKIARAYSDSR